MIASENPPGFVPRTGAHDQGLGAVKDFVPWAADPISDRSVAAVETIERAVTVDLIATFEPQLRCCAKTDSIVSLLADRFEPSVPRSRSGDFRFPKVERV